MEREKCDNKTGLLVKGFSSATLDWGLNPYNLNSTKLIKLVYFK